MKREGMSIPSTVPSFVHFALGPALKDSWFDFPASPQNDDAYACSPGWETLIAAKGHPSRHSLRLLTPSHRCRQEHFRFCPFRVLLLALRLLSRSCTSNNWNHNISHSKRRTGQCPLPLLRYCVGRSRSGCRCRSCTCNISHWQWQEEAGEEAVPQQEVRSPSTTATTTAKRHKQHRIEGT